MTWEDAKTYQSQLETFLAENATNATITGGVDDATIAEAEAALGVRFPDSYRWYLHRFGYCSLYGVEILGIGRAGTARLVDATERRRRAGMPGNFIVLENVDEFVHALDVPFDDPTDARVVRWYPVHGGGAVPLREVAPSFCAFVLECWIEAKAVWE